MIAFRSLCPSGLKIYTSFYTIVRTFWDSARCVSQQAVTLWISEPVALYHVSRSAHPLLPPPLPVFFCPSSPSGWSWSASFVVGFFFFFHEELPEYKWAAKFTFSPCSPLNLCPFCLRCWLWSGNKRADPSLFLDNHATWKVRVVHLSKLGPESARPESWRGKVRSLRRRKERVFS